MDFSGILKKNENSGRLRSQQQIIYICNIPCNRRIDFSVGLDITNQEEAFCPLNSSYFV